MPQPPLIVVDGVAPADPDDPYNLREKAWSFAMDQRAFGPDKIMVAFADADGRFLGLAYTGRTDPLLLGLEACLRYMGDNVGQAAAGIVFCDEAVPELEPSEFGERFLAARELAARFGVHLVDWFACDDERMWPVRLRTLRIAEQPDWWDVPAAS